MGRTSATFNEVQVAEAGPSGSDTRAAMAGRRLTTVRIPESLLETRGTNFVLTPSSHLDLDSAGDPPS